MFVRLVVGLALYLLSAVCMAEKQYALLIGVSEYPTLANEELHIKGPANDVQRMRQVLVRRGFDEGNIRVLAHGVPHAVADPTRKNILAELSGLVERAGQGDFVFIEFSGHGAQQPWTFGSKPQPEPDGLNEMFLPYDVGQWNGAIGAVENTITDVEIGTALSRIQDKGAFVWAVFDTCHAGGLTRGEKLEGDGAIARVARAEDLGIPISQQALDWANAHAEAKTMARELPNEATRDPANAGSPGRYVYLYAVQKWQLTHERPHEKAGVYGDLTWNLALAIDAAPDITYRQLFEYLRQLYSEQGLSEIVGWEGTSLETPLFGKKNGARVWQWPVEGVAEWTIAAGRLNQIGVGDLFGLYPSAVATSDEIIGYARARQVDMVRAVLVPTAYNERPKPGRLPHTTVARLVEHNYSFVLRVATPSRPRKESEGADTRAYERVLAAIGVLKKSPPAGLRAEWVDVGEAADIRLAVADAQLWLLPPDGELIRKGVTKTLSIDLERPDAEWTADLRDILVSAAKAVNLRRLAVIPLGQKDFKPDIDIEVKVVGPSVSHTYQGWDVPQVATGDKVYINLSYRHPIEMDITVFAIDARYGITKLYPAISEVDDSRLALFMKPNKRNSLVIPSKGEGFQFNCEKCGQPTFGKESFIFVVIENPLHSPPENLSFYQQASAPDHETRSNIRGGSLSQLLAEAGFGNATEGTRGQVHNVAIWSMDYVVRESNGGRP